MEKEKVKGETTNPCSWRRSESSFYPSTHFVGRELKSKERIHLIIVAAVALPSDEAKVFRR